MKVLGSTGSNDKTATEIELDLAGLSKTKAAEVKQDVGEFLVEQILLTVAEAKSPVSGERWPGLSKDYKKLKEAEGGTPVANMELTGEMLNSLTFKPTDKGIEVGFFDEQAAKADGHNKFSGKENHTPKRRFLPGEGQHFRKQIESEVSKIIAEKRTVDVENIDVSSITSLDSKTAQRRELIKTLKSELGDMPISDLRQAVLANKALLSFLVSNSLWELL